MKRLFAIEWNKIIYHKTTRNFTLFYFLILILLGVIISNIKPEIGGFKLNLKDYGMFNFPVFWQNITYTIAIVKIFIAVIVIANITNEYDNTTLKQNLIDGLTKKEFILSKTMTNVIFALLSTLFVLVIGLVLGAMYSNSDTSYFAGIQYVFAYFVKLLLFFSLCSFLAVLLKKNSFAFLGLVGWWIIESIIYTIEKLFSSADFLLSNYLPLSISGRLITVPKLQLQNFTMGGSIFQFTSIHWDAIFFALVYSVMFVYFSYRLIQRRDL